MTSRTIQANVLQHSPSGKITVAFDTHDPQGKVITLFELPCETSDQAWAVADAFNHPESNSNEWRKHLLEEELEFYSNGFDITFENDKYRVFLGNPVYIHKLINGEYQNEWDYSEETQEYLSTIPVNQAKRIDKILRAKWDIQLEGLIKD